MMEIEGICNYDETTTVLCHRGSYGASMKCDDFEAAVGCSACHDYIDGRSHPEVSQGAREQYFEEGRKRTMRHWLAIGKLRVT